jgi:hypothetical protein
MLTLISGSQRRWKGQLHSLVQTLAVAAAVAAVAAAAAAVAVAVVVQTMI